MDYDLFVIGGGTAGLNSAKTAHNLGANLALQTVSQLAGMRGKQGES